MASQDSQPFHWHYAELDDENFAVRGRTLFLVVIIFAIILLTTLLFFYARWVCHLRDDLSPSSTSHATDAQFPGPPQPRQLQGLDVEAISRLPIIVLASVEEGECCICLGVFEDDEKVKMLPGCGHCFHPECVDRWLSTQSSCPLCRASLRDSPIVIE